MTAQVHENLFLADGQASMATCPSIPEDHAMIESVPLHEISLLIEQGKAAPVVMSTACWRKYIATWEIRDNRLYLISIEGIYKIKGPEPILADWYSGMLRVPRGNPVKYVHMGFKSVYEKNTIFTVEKGIITDVKEIGTEAAIPGDLPNPG